MKRRYVISVAFAFVFAFLAIVIFVWSPWQGSSVPESNLPLIETGRALYEKNCLSCHGDQNAPMVLGQPPPHNGAGHTWHHADADLRTWILEGKPYNMPAFKQTLVLEDVEAILEYVKTWWSPEQRSRQAAISKNYQDALDRQKENK